MVTLEGKTFTYRLDGDACCCSFVNKLTGREYIEKPDFTWRLIYSEGQRGEIPVWSRGQKAEISTGSDSVVFFYHQLQGDGRILDVDMTVTYAADEKGLVMKAKLENRDPADMMELYLAPVSGVRSLGDDPAADSIAWPIVNGMRVENPSYSDLSVHSGFRKYERHDQYHTDLCNTYPARLSMQWFDLYNQTEGLYIGSHDTTHHTVALDCEREVSTNTLRLGAIRYPMLRQGESEEIMPVVAYPHLGDWHAGSAMYRRFMEASGLWRPTGVSAWAKRFPGWLRVILKQHHLECNWTYRDIPKLFDEAEAAGLDTLFLLGWEEGGFARRWPDYVPDEGALGGTALLKQGIDYVHAKGGKVLMFLSYSLLDHQSSFYLNEKGEECTFKSLWQEEIPFSETYCGEGTWRKMGNPPMPMYLSCPGSDRWQRKMLKSADVCLELGADGVLYDLGGLPPYFCFDSRHHHKKPSHSCEQKAERFHELSDHIHSYGERYILMEHTVDTFNQYMDVAQPGGALKKGNMPEMYRYTFPELVLTNREMGQDETDLRHHINYTAAYGLRFDMTIWRCCGTLSDIPAYTAYLTEINALRKKYGKYLLEGRFRDRDGVTCSNENVRPFLYEAEDGTKAVLCWNDTEEEQIYSLTFANGSTATRRLSPQSIEVITEQ